jgi:hypothetical protein
MTYTWINEHVGTSMDIGIRPQSERPHDGRDEDDALAACHCRLLEQWQECVGYDGWTKDVGVEDALELLSQSRLS